MSRGGVFLNPTQVSISRWEIRVWDKDGTKHLFTIEGNDGVNEDITEAKYLGKEEDEDE